MRLQSWFLVGLLCYTVAARLLPYFLHQVAGLKIDPAGTIYPWNFSPLPAVCLFAGACFADRRLSFALPLAAWFLGDLGIWVLTGRPDWAFYPSQPFVYLSYALIVVLGCGLRSRRPAWAVAGMGLAASLQFFIVTNFGVWALGDGTLYPRTAAGLIECYVAAVPFFRNWMIGMAVFLPILFSPLAFAEAIHPQTEVEAGQDLAPALEAVRRD